jgi:hypothetical protein
MKDNTIIMVLLIVFLFSIMRKNRKENFTVDTCDCQDRWYYWAPKSVDGIDTIDKNDRYPILFKGCDENVKLADNSKRKWCYTKGDCSNEKGLVIKDASGNKISGGLGKGKGNTPKGKQHLAWRYCNTTKSTDDTLITPGGSTIDGGFNRFKKSIGDEMCKDCSGNTMPGNSACFYNLNKCVDACYPKLESKLKVLKELKPLMGCKTIIEQKKPELQLIGKCKYHLEKIKTKLVETTQKLSTAQQNNIVTDIKKHTTELKKLQQKLQQMCGKYTTNIMKEFQTPGSVHEQGISGYLNTEFYNIIKSTEEHCTDEQRGEFLRNPNNIANYFKKKYREIGSKHIDYESESCRKNRGTDGAILVYNLNTELKTRNQPGKGICCQENYNCDDFMRAQLTPDDSQHTGTCNKDDCHFELIDPNILSKDVTYNSFNHYSECSTFNKGKNIKRLDIRDAYCGSEKNKLQEFDMTKFASRGE